MTDLTHAAIVEMARRRLERVTIADLIASGDLAGYRDYHPTGLCAGIDEEVAEENPCDLCGERCSYRGFRYPEGEYRAFAVCTACQHAAEF